MSVAAATTRAAAMTAEHPWVSFLVRRVVRLAISLAIVVTVAFSMIHLVPGDPVRAALGMTAPTELVEQRRAELGLEHPLPQQYADYVGGLLSGDMGRSFGNDLPVSQIISERFPKTLELAFLALAVVLVIAIPLGIAMAIRTRDGRHGGSELGFAAITGLLATVPEFLFAVGLVFVFAVELTWLPVAGQGGASSYVLPVAALGLGAAAALSRVVRAEALSVLSEDYVRTAHGKRLPARIVHLRHVLPNVLTSALTIGGMLVGGLIAGSVLVETVFAWPGLGSTIVQSIQQKDYPLVQGIVLVYGTAVLVANFVVDLLLAVVDPRSTLRES